MAQDEKHPKPDHPEHPDKPDHPDKPQPGPSPQGGGEGEPPSGPPPR